MNLFELPEMTLILVSICVVAGPALCGLMAYQVSRTHEARNVG